MILWENFRAAMEAHQSKPTEASAATVISAYAAWCADFVPDHAEQLVGSLRAALQKAEAA